jgi:iron complex outermembrane receptor protein
MSIATAALATIPAWTWAAPVPVDPAPSSTRLQEIEVTAQRRPEDALRAAVAVSVLAPDELRDAGVLRPQELTELVPSLQVAASAAPITVYYLRGAGNFTGNALTDSAVAFNVDGVYVGRPHSTAGFFYDLERIEIVKGPQGTLYGRNATGGAINVLTRRPDPGNRSGEASAELGSEDARRFDAAINLPVGGQAALRAAGYRAERDGTMSDGLDDLDDTAGRLSFLARPSEALSIRIGADYYDQGGRGTGSTPIALGPGHRYGISSPESDAFYESQRNGIAGRNFNPMPPTQQLDNHFWGVNAALDWMLGGGTLTVLPTYRESHLDTVGTALGVNVTTLEDDRQTSFEARFASDQASPLNYIVGAYWFDETNDVPLFVPNTQYSMSVQDYATGVESAAFFGRLNWKLSDTFRATVGARYTEEDKFFHGTFDGATRFCTQPTGCPDAERFPATEITPPSGEFNPADGTFTRVFNIVADETETYSEWTWRAALDWDAGASSLLYLSYETGFKSGGFFFSNDSQVFQPEELEALTIGWKSRLLDDRVRLEVEAFHWQYDDQQVSMIMRDTQQVVNLGTRNVGNATMQGVEIAADWLATDATRLSADVQYLDAIYDDFRYELPGPAPPVTGCAVAPEGIDYRVDCSGKRAPYAPEWSVNLSAEQSFALADGSRIVAEARLHYQTATLTGLDFTPLEYQDAYATLGASVTWALRDDRYYVTAYGNNLTDEAIVANSFQPPFGSFAVGTLRLPRLYGVRFGARF